MIADNHRCPRRDEGPYLSDPNGTDTWRTDTWVGSFHVVTTIDGPQGDPVEKCFPWKRAPRTCSFCGSLHPDDVIELLEDGWELDPTTKRYKYYLNPPGHANVSAARLNANLKRDFDRVLPSVPNVVGVLAKFYTMHFSEAQIRRVNDVLKGRKT